MEYFFPAKRLYIKFKSDFLNVVKVMPEQSIWIDPAWP